MTIQIPAYTLDLLNGSESITTLLLAAFAIGVGIGSLLCERMSGHRIELGLVPFGSIGLSLFAMDLYFAQPEAITAPAISIAEFLARPGSWRIWIDLALIGAFGGFLQRTALRTDPETLEAPAPVKNHRGQQHHQRLPDGRRLPSCR